MRYIDLNSLDLDIIAYDMTTRHDKPPGTFVPIVYNLLDSKGNLLAELSQGPDPATGYEWQLLAVRTQVWGGKSLHLIGSIYDVLHAAKVVLALQLNQANCPA